MTELLNKANTIGQNVPVVFEETLNTYVNQRLIQEKQMDEAQAHAREMAVRRFLLSPSLSQWQRDAYRSAIASRSAMDARLCLLDSLFRATSDDELKDVIQSITGTEEPQTTGDSVKDAASKFGQAVVKVVEDIDKRLNDKVAPVLEQTLAGLLKKLDAVGTDVKKRGGL